jgi:hypothetical protein
MPESLRVVVPSRRRTRNMPTIRALLPGATIYVHRGEASDYRAVCDPRLVVEHSIDSGLVEIRNSILERFDEDCIVMIDDDLRGIVPLVGETKRRLVDPGLIAQVIQNSHQCAQDLDLGVFCWSRTRNDVHGKFSALPIRLVCPVASTFGLRGRARRRPFDARFPGRADFDFTLRSLLEDRIVLADMRWYFDHGRIFSGVGGNAGRITDAQAARAEEALRTTWGRWIGDGPKRGQIGTKFSATMSVAVSRRNPGAVRLH